MKEGGVAAKRPYSSFAATDLPALYSEPLLATPLTRIATA
jgi:hypothetical protein